jgi:hypothetical protein
MGIWEHARFSHPRTEHGLCVDDNARALILLLGQPELSPELHDMAAIYMRFLEEAALPGGGFHNRRSADGAWVDVVGSDDSQGRAIWALGNAVGHAREPALQRSALDLYDRQGFRQPSPRANAFAVLGAVELLSAFPDHPHARGQIVNWSSTIKPRQASYWPWPEARLAYDNARLPEALLAAGVALEDEPMMSEALRLLEWLVEIETHEGHFSFTPVGGWARGEVRPGFDQQPVEAKAMADACARAWLVTNNHIWLEMVDLAAQWFLGKNDLGIALYNPDTGGGYDGLTPTGANLNQGAESTIAALGTLQTALAVRSYEARPQH